MTETPSTENHANSGCGLTRADFHGPTEEPCIDGGQPLDHPCSECAGDLTRLGTCCWADLCGNCEDANQAAMDAAQ